MTDAYLKPRLCHLLKWPDFNGYGFNLHAEKGKAGQYIGKVDADSPAEAAGLKDGDRIVEVNGTNIGNENHQQVVGRIKAGGEQTNLLVVDKETDQHYKDEKRVVKGDLPEVVVLRCPSHDPEPAQEDVPPSYNDVTEEAPVTVTEVETVQSAVNNTSTTSSQYIPRLCHMKKRQNFNGYGFNLHAERDKPGQYIGQIDDDSPAQAADLREGDRIVEVNGTNIESESHQRVIELVKSGGDETRMLVVNKDADEYYKSQGITVSSSMAEVRHISSVQEEEQVSAVVESPPPVFNIPPPPVELPPQEEEDEEFNVDELRDLGSQDEAVEETVEAVQSAEVEAEVPAPEDLPPPPEDEVVENDQIEDQITAEVAETAESAVVSEEITTTVVSEEITTNVVSEEIAERMEEVTQNSEEVAEESVENAVEEVQESLPSEIVQNDVEATEAEVAEVAEDVQAAVEENNVSELTENVPAESEVEKPTETPAVNSTETSIETPAVESAETPVVTPEAPAESEKPAVESSETQVESQKPVVESSETPVESEKPVVESSETPVESEKPVENATESVITNGHAEIAETAPAILAETPSETPSESAPVTPAETTPETPAEKPAETVQETPSEIPSESAPVTPVETTTETPAETPAETPSESAPETPAETPAETTPETPAPEPSPEPPAETAPVKPIKEVESTAVNGSTMVTETVTSYTAPEPTPDPTPAPVSQPDPTPAPKQANGTGDPVFGMTAAEMKERLKSRKKADPRSTNVGFVEKHKLFERM